MYLISVVTLSFPFLITSKVQLNVNVETVTVSQIDENKDRDGIASITIEPADTQSLAGFGSDGHYNVHVVDGDHSGREDKKYPLLV